MLEARRCPVCGETFFPPTTFCQKDGAQLNVTQTLIGTLLDDRYRIDDILGTGGMGAVYRATHIHLESQFAVKVLHPEMISYDGAIERFRREAKAARRIHHPNAIEVTDFGVTDDKQLVYLVMEIVEGRLLRDMVNEGPFDVHRAVEILSQVCAAIQAAHDNNVIHRDLKPDNIIVQTIGGKEVVKVLDFGIAKMLEANQPTEEQPVLTKQGMLIGTPQYMSPEQCMGRELEPPSDIYSIGIIAYEMLAGNMPFQSQSQMGFIAKHLRESPLPLRAVNPKVPPSIERVVMQTLEKEPRDRPATATELTRLLRQALREAEAHSDRSTLIEADPVAKITQVYPDGVQTPQQQARHTEPEPKVPRETRGPRTQKEVDPPRVTRMTDDRLKPPPPKSKLPIFAGGAGVAIALAVALYFAVFRTPDPKPQGNDPTPTPVVVNPTGEMMLIRGGKMAMGSNEGDADERPVHDVTVNDFYLDQYEVTNEQYAKCVAAGKCRAPANWTGGAFKPEESLLPVTHVRWSDADSYARFAGKRLPTEAEWEYATRGGDANKEYPWGPRWEEGAANVGRENVVRPAPVGSFRRDQVGGVFDLAGNVSEWVADDYKSYVAGEPDKGCPGCKVYRGGNFVDEIRDSRATKRWSIFPDVPAPYDKSVLPKVGFRCAKDAK